jgi:hypothetical protein
MSIPDLDKMTTLGLTLPLHTIEYIERMALRDLDKPAVYIRKILMRLEAADAEWMEELSRRER